MANPTTPVVATFPIPPPQANLPFIEMRANGQGYLSVNAYQFLQELWAALQGTNGTIDTLVQLEQSPGFIAGIAESVLAARTEANQVIGPVLAQIAAMRRELDELETLANPPRLLSPPLLATGVTAGAYVNTNLTVNAFGQLTAAASGFSVASVASSATVTPPVTAGVGSQYEITALAAAATIAIPTGTQSDGQKLMLRFLDNGTARGLTWTTSAGGYRPIGVTLPTTTVLGKTLYVGCIYNSADSFWDVVATAQQ